MFVIRVPCSTSNLGPGFDALGLALSLHLLAEVEASDAVAVAREGDAPFAAVRDDDDLFLKALRARRASRGAAGGVRATLRTAIPTGRGLGSSAASVVAGVMAADALDGVAHDPASVLAAAARVEGHPDNVAPEVLGGLCCAYADDAAVRALRVGDLAHLRAVVASPDEVFATSASRGALPRELSHREATHNLGRAVFLSHALARGETRDLAWAFEDRMHQPYRARLLPGLTEAVAAAVRAGAVGASLSGAGSSAVALVDRADHNASRVADAMRDAYAAAGVRVTLRTLDVDRDGASVHHTP